jgi:uncharacterized lipoprotein YajG
MKILFLLMSTLTLFGCATQRFDLQAPSTSAIASVDDAQVFWVGGIGQQKEVDAAKVCGSAAKVARVETQETPMNVLSRVITLSIYAPRQVRVYCAE